MIKRLSLLNGLAIVAVVLNHAAGWGWTAMFWWTHRYRPVTVPNFDQMGSLAYYLLFVMKRLTTFSVPVFLFVSGFFIAYSAKGRQSALNWKMVQARLTNLLIPYLLWSLGIFAVDYVEKTRYSPLEYVERLGLGKATGAYFFVPVLCQLFLLSLLLAPIAKQRPILVIAGTACLQLGVMGSKYMALMAAPSGTSPAFLIPAWAFPLWIFYFAFGVVFGFHTEQLKPWLKKFRRVMLMAGITLAVLTILEPEVLNRLTGQTWRDEAWLTSSGLYAVTLILCFLTYDQVPIPGEKQLARLSPKTYGIYLMHPKVLELVARLLYHVTPWILAYQLLLQPVLITLALGIPLAIMTLTALSPAKRSYRYLFG